MMANKPVLNPSINIDIDDFFVRSGLTPQDRIDCYNFIEQLYPGKYISPALCQGYCSMTIFVGEDMVIQFRPNSYRLDLRTTRAAREVYGTFAPETRFITTIPASGLLVYSMERMDGISLKDMRASNALLGRSTFYRARICKDFAAFLSKSWTQATVSDLPLGVVGKTITARLKSLSTD